MRLTLLAPAILICTLLPAPASAQPADPLEVRYGMRMRVTWTDHSADADRNLRREGLYLGQSGESIVLAGSSAGERVHIPRGDVDLVEVSIQPGHRGTGMKRGALIGVGVGAAVGLTSSIAADDELAPGWGAVFGGVLGGVAGLVIGGLVSSGEQWESVPVESLQLEAVSRPGVGSGLALSFAF